MTYDPKKCEARDGNDCLGPDCPEGLSLCCYECQKRESCGERCTPEQAEDRVLH
jgi:hypothetical protein